MAHYLTVAPELLFPLYESTRGVPLSAVAALLGTTGARISASPTTALTHVV